MGNISSANFKKSTNFNPIHNVDIRPPWANGSGDIEFNRNGFDALKLKNQIIQDAKDAYERNRKPKSPKFKAKSYEWSLVVNLKESNTMQDLEKLSKHFADKYGFQCYQIAFHKDEGYINDDGEFIPNLHAHLEFITLDKETGKNNYRREKISPRVLRDMQSEVAEILQMERGVDKRLSGAKRIEPRAYAAMKEAEKAQNRELNEKIGNKLDDLRNQIQVQYNEIAILNRENKKLNSELLTQKQINERLSAERKAMIERGWHTVEDYKAMTALRNELKNQQITNQQLEQAIKNLRDELENERKAREDAEKKSSDEQRAAEKAQLENTKLQGKIAGLENQIQTKDGQIAILNQIKTTFETMRKGIDEQNKIQVQDYIKNLENERRARENAESERDRLSSELVRAQQQNTELQGRLSDLENNFNEYVEQEIAKRDEEWRQFIKKNFQNNTPENTQNELSTNAQNDDSNTKLFKNH